MRLDRYRRRHNSSPQVPPSPLPRYNNNDRDDFRPWPVSDFNSDSSRTHHHHSHQTPPDSRPGHQPAATRPDYITALEARMSEMEKVPTSSFFHSYAGEFDMLLGEDRQASRRIQEFETSTRAENAHRNRYANILSNEPTRVKLTKIAPGENDYINANRVSGHRDHPGYIATQAPLPETTPHFWQMVHESDSPVIIMLTREQEDHCEVARSDQYWPDLGQNLLYCDYMVHAVDHINHQQHGVIERTFDVVRVVDKRKKYARDLVHADSLHPPATDKASWQTPSRSSQATLSSCGPDDDSNHLDPEDEELLRHLELIGPVLHVTQLQYIDWPDQHVPSNPYTLLDLCARVDNLLITHKNKTDVYAPPIVHCSAGVGRTGTFIAVDRTLRRLWDAFSPAPAANTTQQQTVCVDEIRELVRKLKNERSRMVQTAEQYRFIYHAVLAGMKKWEQGQSLFGDDAGTLR